MNKQLRRFAAPLISGLLLLGACAPVPVVTVSEQEISAAQDSGELEALYTQISQQLAAFTRESHPADFARLDAIGERLAKVRAADVRALMNQHRLDNELVPQNILDRATSRAAEIRRWDDNTGALLDADIVVAGQATQAAIDAAAQKQRALGAEQFRERIAVLDELIALTGDAGYQQQREALVNSVAKQAAAAKAAENLEQAKSLLEALPDSEDTRKQRAEVDRRLFEKRFNQALAASRPDEAYNHFVALTASPTWNDVKPDLKGTGAVLVNYFKTLATDAADKDKLADAHRWFMQAHHMDAALDLGGSHGEAKPFLKKISALANKVRKQKDRTAQELGLLYIIETLDPGRPEVRGRVRELQGMVAALAPREVSTTAFRDPAGDYKFGDKIAAGITQYLFKSIPHDVRIIEREQYEAIKREQDLRGASSLSSVDYIITGSVLEAKVENTQQKNRRTMRVVTETGTRSNPAYLEWLKLTEGQQDRIDEPSQTEDFEKREDVSINVTIHRKVGIFSVSYRLIDAHSGKVLFPDSVTESVEFSDESTEGVQLGEFTLDFKLAKLPSDVEILNGLAAKISEDIGKKLTDRLNDQEISFAHSAELKAEEGRYLEAVDLFASAEAIAHTKGQDTRGLGEQLSTFSLIAAAGAPSGEIAVQRPLPVLSKPKPEPLPEPQVEPEVLQLQAEPTVAETPVESGEAVPAAQPVVEPAPAEAVSEDDPAEADSEAGEAS